MRTKITLGVVRESQGTFPNDADLCQWLRSFGWEPKEASVKNNEDEKLEEYRKLAESMFAQMHEVAQDEKGDLIFATLLPSEQMEFLVTRSCEGEITFRFLHEDLPHLFAGTNRVVRAIHDQVYKKTSISSFSRLWGWIRRSTTQRTYGTVYFIPNNKALLYERASSRVIMRGRIIRSFFKEAYRTNIKDALVSIIGGSLIAIFVVAKTIISKNTNNTQQTGNLQELSRINELSYLVVNIISPMIGAITVASFIGIVGFIISYRKILWSTIISWEPVSDH